MYVNDYCYISLSGPELTLRSCPLYCSWKYGGLKKEEGEKTLYSTVFRPDS